MNRDYSDYSDLFFWMWVAMRCGCLRSAKGNHVIVDLLPQIDEGRTFFASDGNFQLTRISLSSTRPQSVPLT